MMIEKNKFRKLLVKYGWTGEMIGELEKARAQAGYGPLFKGGDR